MKIPQNKKIVLGALILIAMVTGFLLRRDDKSGSPGRSLTEQMISHYTCPMHPPIHAEKPGDCPICGMKLVAVYKERRPQSGVEGEGLDGELGRTAPAATPMEGATRAPVMPGVISISPDRQQLIGIKTATVEKKEFVKTIHSPARAAFDAELAVAQAEFASIARSVPSLRRSATARLHLFGMSDTEIKALADRGRPDPALLLPVEGGSVWVYAPLYGPERDEVKEGMKAIVHSGTDPFDGTVRGIEPVADPITRSVRARIEVKGGGGKILPESFLEVIFEIPVGEELVVPKTAILETGNRTVAFVIHDGIRFEMREVKAGAENDEERVVLEGLTEGETVAAGASFLLDSESQLKAAVQGMGGHSH